MGENGGKTTGQVLSHGSCACLAWCSMSLAHIQRVGSAGLAVKDDRNGRCIKVLILQNCDSKGYSRVINQYRRRPRATYPLSLYYRGRACGRRH